MRHPAGRPTPPSPGVIPPLTRECLIALQKACAPVGLLSFPPPDIIHALRRHGYVQIVLGGIQITPLGLERLLLERRKAGSADKSGAAMSDNRPIGQAQKSGLAQSLQNHR